MSSSGDESHREDFVFIVPLFYVFIVDWLVIQRSNLLLDIRYIENWVFFVHSKSRYRTWTWSRQMILLLLMLKMILSGDILYCEMFCSFVLLTAMKMISDLANRRLRRLEKILQIVSMCHIFIRHHNSCDNPLKWSWKMNSNSKPPLTSETQEFENFHLLL